MPSLGAASGRRGAGGWSPWRAIRWTSRHSISAAAPAGCGRRRTAATYWRCVSDGFLRTAAIGALAVAPSDRNVIYAGTGETEIRIDVSYGDGIYKSDDAGRTLAAMPGCRTASISAESRSIRATPTSRSRRCWATSSAPARSAACIRTKRRRRRAGSGCCSATRTAGASTLPRSGQSAGGVRVDLGRRGATSGT